MLLNCEWVSKIMEGHAPTELAMTYDNVGFIIGSKNAPLKKLLVALDLTDEVTEEAIEKGVDMVLTHHPLIFKPIKKITDESALGRRIINLIRNNISVYAAHTNLDISEGGTNDVLADLLNLSARTPLEADATGNGLGRIGELKEPQTLGELAHMLKKLLNLSAIGVTGDLSRVIRRVGLCTGSGAEYISVAALKGCDVYITGDVTYHSAQLAVEQGLSLIDATHYGTEVIVVKALKHLLETRAEDIGADLTVLESEVDARTIDYVV